VSYLYLEANIPSPILTIEQHAGSIRVWCSCAVDEGIPEEDCPVHTYLDPDITD
jgi:hypothetical protein